ncbi:MAG TPA: ferric reductase-like transmembrane domain-containing protein [Acidimicrobiales bacterium]|nr:ferric reductase-like transmembrane domain-containing protein [Acidimicrobiales bacterium]
MPQKLWWYVARAGGLTAWWLITASVIWGLLLSTRVANGKPRPAWLLDLHRFLGALAVVFTAIHVGGLVADSWSHFGWSQVLVPLTSSWRPVAVAWGVVAFYVLLAVEASSLLVRHLPRRLWRAVHRASFGLFVLAGAHALTAGSEAGNPAVRWSAVLASGIVGSLVVYRLARPRRLTRSRPPRPPHTSATAAPLAGRPTR